MESSDRNAETNTQAPDVYTWEVPGKPISVEIDLDVVDRLNAEVMRGYGSVPRRAVEVGGILLGSTDEGERLTVRIEDFEPVATSHAQGPGYILSGSEREKFEEALERWLPEPGRLRYAIGFYRSHTREALSLSPQDLEFFAVYFAGESGIALLIKPSTTRPPTAGLFFREEGTIRSESSYLEFPFRRRELSPVNAEPEPPEEEYSPYSSDEPAEDAGRLPSAVPARSLRLRGGWVWLPLSFIFLLLGTVLGFQVALSVRSQISATPREDPYALRLTATPSADSVHLRWDRSSPAIQKATRGVLVISDSGTQKNVDLDASHLHNGSVIYRRASNDVGFRLEVFTHQKVSIAETLQFQAQPPAGGDAGGVQ